MVGLDNVSKLIVLSGSIVLDGIEYTDEVDCRELTGEHELEVKGEFDFRPMTDDDRAYLRVKAQTQHTAELAGVTMELLSAQYELMTGEELQ